MGLRRLLLVVSSVATVVLGLEKIGVYQFVPGGDVHFQSQPFTSSGHAGLSLQTDAGDLTCWIRLVLRMGPTSQTSFGAPSWSGDPLAIVVRSLGMDRQELTISKQPNPPIGTPFLWRAGLPLDLETSPPAGPIRLEDWFIFPNNQPSDGHSKARRRWWWTRISWGLLIISLVGTALTALKEKEERETVTTLSLVRTIIISIEGRDQIETKRLRAFLTKVLLQDTPVKEALTSAGIPENDMLPRYSFLARATSLFLERIQVVEEELDRYSSHLSP